MRGVDLIPDTVCKSRWCRQIPSRLRADLRENPIKQWASRDALIQSAGSISDIARYHSDANIALGPILKMYIPGQIRIFNALNSDGYSTGNAPPSGNNAAYVLGPHISWALTNSSTLKTSSISTNYWNPKLFLTLPELSWRSLGVEINDSFMNLMPTWNFQSFQMDHPYDIIININVDKYIAWCLKI